MGTKNHPDGRLRQVHRREPVDAGRDPRRSVALAGFGVLEDGRIYEISVVDLSYDGCKVEIAEALTPGTEMRVSILGLGGALGAAVCWFKDGRAGLRFRS